ncbi:MAG: DUF3426 domain-containing protein [Proteobacteria bacterium]|nr:DUF3426 domain-containing protein [Pseudomonadota bacterium]
MTAADLRVAQGYVRCGRCSNVFNALSRLSEDRQAGAAAVPQTTGTSVQPQAAPEPAPPPAPKPTAPPPPQRADATSRSKALQPPPAPEPMRYGDDTEIPEEDLEFNPDATDINKVFVEPPPSPKFTAATGTFKAIRMEAEDAARIEQELARTGEREAPEHTQDSFDPVDTQVDVEIDPDLLATMAHLTENREERLGPTPESDFSAAVFAATAGTPPPAATPPAPAGTNSTSATGTMKALAGAKASAPQQSQLSQPPAEPPPAMRLAERAKARADAAKTGTKPDTRPNAEIPKPAAAFAPDDARGTPSDTAAALRDLLSPRKRTLGGADEGSAEQPTSLFAGAWPAGSAILLLMLLIQIVHHYRHDLAATATFNGPLTSIYAALGIPIVPNWDPAAYEVRQLGASTSADAPGQITVLASVKNGAHQAQPLPLLRVTLQDRFGNRIASRDVPPKSYLPRAIPSTSRLSAGQRIDAEMAFVDPGADAVGFEIDACLPAPGGGIACANDIAR